MTDIASWRRWGRRIVATVVVAAVVSPAARGSDSFPLSTYPMYASARNGTATFATARGIDASGDDRRLSMRTIARTDDPLIAQSRVAEAIRSGAAALLCAEIAERARRPVTRVEVIEERHDLVAHVAGRVSLRQRILHARCQVGE